MELSFIVAGHRLAYEISPETCPETYFRSFMPFRSEDTDKEALTTIRFVGDIGEEGSRDVVTGLEREPGMTGVDVLETAEGNSLFRIVLPDGSIGGRLEMDKEYKRGKAALYGTDNEKFSAFTSLTVLAFSLASAPFGTLMVHSSVVSHNGKAWMFLGKSGTGKSTHTRLWLRNIEGCSLMNDDHPVIRVVDSVPMVYGSPWSGKTPCYKNVCAPAGGIVRLKQAPFNRISRLGIIESYAALLPSCSGISWEKKLGEGRSRTVEKVITSVPMWSLECLPDAEAAFLCHDTIAGSTDGCGNDCHKKPEETGNKND